MLTWSFGWIGSFEPSSPPASSIARFAMTSFTFMFVCVPEPVCHTHSGKCSSSVAVDDLVGGGDDQVGQRAVEQARAGVRQRGRLLEERERADDLDRHPVAAGSPIEKWWSDRWVCAPQYRSAGTSIGPMRVGLGAGVGHRGQPLGAKNLTHHPPMPGGWESEGRPVPGRPLACAREGRGAYPPGCVTPFTSSVYGAYCVTNWVPSW